jgi:O-6-methylguanine DNA methyltransferase
MKGSACWSSATAACSRASCRRWPRLNAPLVPGRHRWLDALRTQLEEYFAGHRTGFDLPLVIRGTPFQEQVWRALLDIPSGETWSYRDVAQRIGHAGATRAVGTANGMNRIAIVIPCHRVVNADGRLGGYGGGLWRKQFLLDLERGQGRLEAREPMPGTRDVPRRPVAASASRTAAT